MKIAHLSATPNWATIKDCNWGDRVLVAAVEHLIPQALRKPVEFMSMNCRQKFTDEKIDLINSCDAMIIGPGGLFLSDTINVGTGWQCGIQTNQWPKIKVPVILYSLGWNFFPGQTPSPDLKPNLKAMLDRVSYISLRHSKDVENFSEYTGSSVAKMDWCPSMMYANEFSVKHDLQILAVSLAADRPGMRVPGGWKDITDGISQFMKNGRAIYTPHMGMDSKIPGLPEGYNSIPLHRTGVEEGMRVYNDCDFVVSMRGHAQMIPFALGAVPLSIVTHEKLERFAVDAGITDILCRPGPGLRTDLGNAAIKSMDIKWNRIRQMVFQQTLSAVNRIVDIIS